MSKHRPVFSGPSGRKPNLKRGYQSHVGLVDDHRDGLELSFTDLGKILTEADADRTVEKNFTLTSDKARFENLNIISSVIGGLKSGKMKTAEMVYDLLGTDEITFHGTEEQLRNDPLSGSYMNIRKRLVPPFKLEKPQGSSLHHVMDYLRESVVTRSDEIGFSVLKKFQPFLIEHDWDAMLRRGTFDDGEYPMPFDMTCFEMRINGVRILVLVSMDDRYDKNTVRILAGYGGSWYNISEELRLIDGELIEHGAKEFLKEDFVILDGIRKLVSRQIRAVCIMLDAKVAEVETVRVSEKLNSIREKKGRARMNDYSVVSLVRRHRAAPMPEDHVVTPGAKKRMHFRRSHWRHYPTHRVRIPWLVVGDPDLGVVIHEYRL